ncbi:hypothetical protein AZH53_06175 [Methanomicrobiaceae archaeon CYW5]|uniref:hypothetical protein n=1 Tax=Methanovulcanius yangii TaxID=1789227 RepID=UPI0029CA6CE3|nr:hypothetical protein [Methanovulcanius yangii]MBT8507995.1 hypothetical protein [Methanovulcanius yangii]
MGLQDNNRKREKMKKARMNVSIDHKTLNALDEVRGLTSRSSIVNNLLIVALGVNDRSETEKAEATCE